LQSVDRIDACLQCCEQLVPFFRQHIQFSAHKEHGDPFCFHFLKRGDDAVKNLPHFPQ